jgi:hypothetical protein
MPEYRKQHYLPAVYLREFSVDPTHIDRDSKVWRCDLKIHSLVPVQTQCFGNHFYSKDRAEAVEKMFQNMEGFYGQCVRTIKAGLPPTKDQFFGLVLMIFDLHIRNESYANETGQENLHAYSLRLHALKTQILSGRKKDDLSDDDVARLLQERWHVRILHASEGNDFATSDNPSIWIASRRQKPTVQLAILPVTPKHLAVAYDKTLVAVVGEQTAADDEKLLNLLQCSCANRAIYSFSPLSLEQQGFVREQLARPTKARGMTNQKSWGISLRRLTPGFEFSFIQPVAPLF